MTDRAQTTAKSKTVRGLVQFLQRREVQPGELEQQGASHRGQQQRVGPGAGAGAGGQGHGELGGAERSYEIDGQVWTGDRYAAEDAMEVRAGGPLGLMSPLLLSRVSRFRSR